MQNDKTRSPRMGQGPAHGTGYDGCGPRYGAGAVQPAAMQSAGAVLAFAAMPDEPDTAEILRRALADGKRLLLPACGAKPRWTGWKYRHCACCGPGVRHSGAARRPARRRPGGIRRGAGLCPLPGRQPRRGPLGRGGGYYDRFLAHYKGAGLLLCPEALLLDELPCDDWDAHFAPENILTEKGILR